MAVTFATPYGGTKALQWLENQTITNQSETSKVHARAVTPPSWAHSATFFLNVTAMGGTSPLLDFKLETVDPIDLTSVAPLGDWDGITQKTGTAALITVEIGPRITADDTGSATAACRYGVNATLPPVILYTITTDGTTDDEDYTFTLAVHWSAA